MLAHGVEQRRINQQMIDDQATFEAEEKARVRAKELATIARARAQAAALGEAGNVEDGSLHGQTGDQLGPTIGDYEGTMAYLQRAKGLVPGKGPAYRGHGC